MTTLERVAMAICKARGIYPTEWREFLPEARAALMAIREVTPEMQRAGNSNEDRSDVCATYRAMIDAILAEEEL